MSNTYLHPAAWGIILELDELEKILANITDSQNKWSTRIADDPSHKSCVEIIFISSLPNVELTVVGYSFPLVKDDFPWLISPPLVLLHPAFAGAIKRNGVERIDSCADFGTVWEPIREALTVEGLRGAADHLSGFAEGRRSRNVR